MSLSVYGPGSTAIATLAGGRELAYAETTTSFTANGTATLVPGLSITVPAGNRPYVVQCSCVASAATALAYILINLLQDGVALAYSPVSSSTAGAFVNLTVFQRVSAANAATAHTYTIKCQTNTGAGTLYAGAGVMSPFITAREL